MICWGHRVFAECARRPRQMGASVLVGCRRLLLRAGSCSCIVPRLDGSLGRPLSAVSPPHTDASRASRCACTKSIHHPSTYVIHGFLFSDTDTVRVSPYLCIVPSYLYTVFVKTRTRACKKYHILSFLSPNFRPLGALHSYLLYIPSSSLFLASARFLFDSLCHSHRFHPDRSTVPSTRVS